METGFPLVMLIGPFVAAVAALIAGRYRRVSAAVGLVALAILTLLLSLAAPGTGLLGDNTAGFFGRAAMLTPFVRSLFLFIYPAMGALFLFAWFRPLGRALVPAGLALLSPLAAVLMVSPIGLGAVLLVVAAAFVVPILHDGRFEAAGAAWRFFLIVTVAASLLMLTATGQIGGGYPLSWFAPLLAAIMLLGGFPLHIWVEGLTRRSSAAAMVIVLGLMQFVVVTFLLVLLDSTPAARASTEFQSTVRWSAVITAMVASFQMIRAATWRDIAAGAVLMDMGFLLLATLAPGAGGLVIALPALMARYLGLMLVMLGLTGLVAAGASTRWERISAALSPAMLIYGCLTLLGLPLTPGFAGRWAQLNAVGQGSGSLAVVLLIAAAAIGAAAVWRAALRRPETDEIDRPPLPAASGVETTAAAVILALALLAGLFPNVLTGIAARMLGLT